MFSGFDVFLQAELKTVIGSFLHRVYIAKYLSPIHNYLRNARDKERSGIEQRSQKIAKHFIQVL